jgi:hypothetical protein
VVGRAARFSADICSGLPAVAHANLVRKINVQSGSVPVFSASKRNYIRGELDLVFTILPTVGVADRMPASGNYRRSLGGWWNGG